MRLDVQKKKKKSVVTAFGNFRYIRYLDTFISLQIEACMK